MVVFKLPKLQQAGKHLPAPFQVRLRPLDDLGHPWYPAGNKDVGAPSLGHT